MNTFTPNQTPAPNNNSKKHKLVIGGLGLIIVVLAIALFAKESAAPGLSVLESNPDATSSPEAVKDTTAADQEAINNWTPPTYNPPAAPDLPSAPTTPVTPSSPTNNTVSNPENLAEEISVPNATVVTYQGGRFWPDEARVAEGGMVHFRNNSDEPLWVASDNHPRHDRYIDKSNAKCGTTDFDQCDSIQPGQTWSFAFNRPGTWGYHNHLDAKDTGTIIVVDRDDL